MTLWEGLNSIEIMRTRIPIKYFKFFIRLIGNEFNRFFVNALNIIII